MDRSLEGNWQAPLRRQQDLESYLEAKASELSRGLSGLVDIDLTSGIAICKFSIALLLMDNVDDSGSGRDSARESSYQTARRKVLEGAAILDDAIHTNVSEDQRAEFLESSGIQQARDLLDQILLRGGSAYFEADDPDGPHSKLLSRALAQAMKKYAAPDDRYEPLYRPEDLPQPLRNLVRAFFSTFAPEGQAEPPYGIEEDEEEEIRTAEKMRMPLTQAIHYMENELIPDLEEQLRGSPGDEELQTGISQIWDQIRAYKEMRFIPRARPIVAPKGYYTEGLTEYDENGELLVTIDLPVTIRSGKNLDRTMDLVRAEFTRRIAGRGLCPELDEDLQRAKRLDSGTGGSSLFPRGKLDTRRGYSQLKTTFPELRALDDREQMQRLLETARRSSGRSLDLMIEHSLFTGGDQGELVE